MWNRCREPAEPLEGLRACTHVCKSFVASAGRRELPRCLPPRERAAPLRQELGCRARRSHVSQSCRKADSFAAKQMLPACAVLTRPGELREGPSQPRNRHSACFGTPNSKATEPQRVGVVRSEGTCTFWTHQTAAKPASRARQPASPLDLLCYKLHTARAGRASAL